MMSCTLWRNQESIHRNDENQVFVLTDQSSTRDVATKLNINVRSTHQLEAYLAGLRTPTSLDSYGQLEQDFGVRPVKERRPIKNTAVKAPKAITTNGETHKNGLYPDEDKSEEATLSSGIDLAANVSTPKPNVAGKENAFKSQASQQPAVNNTSSLDRHLTKPSNENLEHDLGGHNVEEKQPKFGKEPTVPSNSQNYEVLPEVPSKTLTHPEKSVTDDLVCQKSSEKDNHGTNNPGTPPHTQAHNVRSRTWADALTGNFSKKVTPVHSEINAPAIDKSIALIEPPLPLPKTSTPPVAEPTKAPEEIEDSDEEVVVFQPKRLSAQQKKPTQQNSRPSTPNVQAQRSSTTKSPRPTTGKGQHAPKVNHRPSKHVHESGLKPPKSSNPAPPVIDPDAFGRDFAVNTNPAPRGNTRGMHVRHSPQASLHHPGLPRSRPTSSHRQSQSSPNQATPKASPQQAPKTPALLNGITGGAETKQLPIGTGRPSPKPVTETRAPSLNANAPIFQPANTPSPLPPSLVQQKPAPTLATAPKLAPIGSGRPSSKKTQQPSGLEEPKLRSEPAQEKPAFVSAPTQPTLPDNQQLDPASVGPPQDQQLFNRTQSQHPHPVKRTFTPTPPFGPQNNVTASRAANGFAPRGRGGAAPPRLAKPSLFDPELDHTKSYQPNIEPRKSAAPQEVQYVLKSGSTREQVRGKGKLWVG